MPQPFGGEFFHQRADSPQKRNPRNDSNNPCHDSFVWVITNDIDNDNNARNNEGCTCHSAVDVWEVEVSVLSIPIEPVNTTITTMAINKDKNIKFEIPAFEACSETSCDGSGTCANAIWNGGNAICGCAICGCGNCVNAICAIETWTDERWSSATTTWSCARETWTDATATVTGKSK